MTKTTMNAKQALSVFHAEQDRYGVASGLKEHSVYRRKDDKYLFDSGNQQDCVDWIERKAMEALLRQLGRRRA